MDGVFLKKDGTPPTQEDKRILFNVMYGGRDNLGNGNYLTTDDGWNFRGRGLKQLTGRYNYTEFIAWHAANQTRWPDDIIDAINHPETLLDMKYATRSAAWFWIRNNGEMAKKANKGNTDEIVNEVTGIINSGTDSYEARRKNFKKLWNEERFG